MYQPEGLRSKPLPHKELDQQEQNMAPRDGSNTAAFCEKLEQLRYATNSNAVNKASILVDASRYIQELKGRVDKLNQDVETLQSSSEEDTLPAVNVETLEKGFLISVFSPKNSPGLLVSILEAFDDLGLDVLDARVSCSHNFRLEAVSENERQPNSVDAQVVKLEVLQAIRKWNDEQKD